MFEGLNHMSMFGCLFAFIDGFMENTHNLSTVKDILVTKWAKRNGPIFIHEIGCIHLPPMYNKVQNGMYKRIG